MLVVARIVEDTATDTDARTRSSAGRIARELLGRVVPAMVWSQTRGGWWLAITDNEAAELETNGKLERSSETTWLLIEHPAS